MHFNLVLDMHKDRTSARQEGTATLGKLDGLIRTMGMGDVWWELHEKGKE